MPTKVSIREMLESGVHFGHRTQKWNPKMRPFIFMQRNGIHILDLQQTHRNLNEYHDMLVEIGRRNGVVLFVGTKRQAQETIATEANRCGMPYVNTRWLGGTLTNWRTIRERIEALKRLEQRRDKGEFELLTKREALMLNRTIEELQGRLGGIRNMKRLPDLVVIVDTIREVTAVRESNTLEIPTLALVDSNCDPDTIDYILPANDDAMRSIKLMVSAIADAILEGRMMRREEDEAFDEEAVEAVTDDFGFSEDEEDDERLLGQSTLAKLRDQSLFDEDEDEA
jgi:small subunit ribosomal protein S2